MPNDCFFFFFATSNWTFFLESCPIFFLTNYLQFLCENVKRMISFQVISCRVIGQAEDNVPIVQLYTATFNQEKGQLESILVNKEV